LGGGLGFTGFVAMEVEKKEEGEAEKSAASSGFGTWVAVRRPFRVDSPFFAAGNVERELLAKQVTFSLCLLPCYQLGTTRPKLS